MFKPNLSRRPGDARPKRRPQRGREGLGRHPTGALVLAHRGEEPATTNRTSAGMRAPGQESETLAASEFGSVSV